MKDVTNYDTTEPILYVHYKGQTIQQDAYVFVDPRDMTVWADYDGEISNAVPHSVWYGIVRRIPIPATLKVDAIRNYVASVIEIINPAAETAIVEWDGNNNVGHWPHWTEQIEADLERLYTDYEQDESANWQVWDVSEWLQDVDIRNVTPETVESEARIEGVILTGNVERYLTVGKFYLT